MQRKKEMKSGTNLSGSLSNRYSFDCSSSCAKQQQQNNNNNNSNVNEKKKRCASVSMCFAFKIPTINIEGCCSTLRIQINRIKRITNPRKFNSYWRLTMCINWVSSFSFRLPTRFEWAINRFLTNQPNQFSVGQIFKRKIFFFVI